MAAHRSLSARPLVVSADEELLDDLLRLLAAAGTEPEVATGGAALRRAHREAPLVLIGADVLPTAPVRALPRRAGVVVVGRGGPPAEVWAAAVELGAERVSELPADEGWLVSRMASALHRPVDRGRLVVVGGSCGGAGTSTVATALAVAVASAPADDGVLLVDTDGEGGGLDLLLGAEGVEGLRWPELAGLRGRVAGDALMAALPETAGVHVLACSREAPGRVPAEALAAVVEAARAGGWPVVVDLARTAGREAAEQALADADLALLVVPGRLRAASAARRLLDPVPDDGRSAWTRAHVVVRLVPGGLSARDVAEVVGRPVLAEVGHDRSAVPRGEEGRPPLVSPRSPLGGLCRRVLAELPRSAEAAA